MDLAACIKKNLHVVKDFDLFVGIPRSGLLVANIIALYLNKPVCTVQELVNNLRPQNGFSRNINDDGNYRNVLIVDDTVNTGKSINHVRCILEQANIKVKYCAIYSTENARKYVDIAFEVLEKPRIFQWNYLNNSILKFSAVCFENIICNKFIKVNSLSRLETELSCATPNLLKDVKLSCVFTGYNSEASVLIAQWLRHYNIEVERIISHRGRNLYNKLGADFFLSNSTEFKDIKLILLGSNYRAKKISEILNIPVIGFNDKIYQ